VRGFLVHAVAYAAINGFLVAVWMLTTGSPDELQRMLQAPLENIEPDFWPIWPMLGWGVGLAIHGGVALVTLPGRTVSALRAGPAVPALPVSPTPEVVHDTGPRRRWLVVMFTDVCDSTALNERLGDDAWHGVLNGYRDVVRAATAARNGTEVATAGDGFLVRFESPSEAVLCAIDVQRALDEQRRSGATMLHARIGLHAGDVVEDGGDVLGHVVNLASRVSSAAQPDEILVTEPVADQMVGSLELEDRGLQPLKGVSQHRHLLAVRWAEATAP
jgi:class 3 adenylate cyclase